MPTVTQSRNASLPPAHEHSFLASPRESDSPLRQAVRANRAASQQDSDKQAIQRLTRTVEQLRRRILGGSQAATTTNPGNWNYRGLYDPTWIIMQYDVVQFGSGTAAGMYLSTIDNNVYSPDSGIGWIQVSTGSGNWL